MNEDLPPTQRSRRAATTGKLAARRQRARAIRRRVAGMSLAAFLAASGAVLVELVTGHDPALGHSRHSTTTVAVAPKSSGSAGRTSSGGHDTTSGSSGPTSSITGSGAPSHSSSGSAGAAVATPSAVTTSAS